MKHRRHKALLAVLLVLVTASALASGSALAESSVLSVSRAIELALEHDISLKMAEINNVNAQISYERAMVNPTPVAKQSAELGWEKAQATLKTARTDVITGALGSFLSLQNAVFDIEIKKRQVEAAQRNWEKTKILVLKGTASTLDELQAELAYIAAVNALEVAGDSHAEAAAAYAYILGMEQLPPLSDANVLVMPPFDMELGAALKTAFANSISIREKEVALEQALVQRAADEALELSRADATLSQNSVTLAELALAKAKADYEASFTSAYNSVVHSKKSLAVAQCELDVEQKKFDIVRKQYESGLKTAADLDNAEIALLRAQKDLSTAERGYVMAWLSFQKMLGSEIDLSGVVKPDESK